MPKKTKGKWYSLRRSTRRI